MSHISKVQTQYGEVWDITVFFLLSYLVFCKKKNSRPFKWSLGWKFLTHVCDILSPKSYGNHWKADAPSFMATTITWGVRVHQMLTQINDFFLYFPIFFKTPDYKYYTWLKNSSPMTFYYFFSGSLFKTISWKKLPLE